MTPAVKESPVRATAATDLVVKAIMMTKEGQNQMKCQIEAVRIVPCRKETRQGRDQPVVLTHQQIGSLSLQSTVDIKHL